MANGNVGASWLNERQQALRQHKLELERLNHQHRLELERTARQNGVALATALQQHQGSREIERYKALRQHELELNRATAAFEHAALQPLTLLNGGALGAFMTLVGATSNSTAPIEVSTVAPSMIAWASGLALAALATGFAYRSQRAFSQRSRAQRDAFEDNPAVNLRNIATDKQGRGECLQNIALAAGAFSIACFGVGVGWALKAFD